MNHRVLLVEPYPDLSRVMTEMLVQVGYAVDVAMTGYEMRAALKAQGYDCVLLNLDQNRALDFGLELAEEASKSGSRIIMIPDHAVDHKTIAAKGWLQLKKPFRIENLVALVKQVAGVDGERSTVKKRQRRHQQGRAR